MSLKKFEYLMSESALYFARLDQLSDTLEGRTPRDVAAYQARKISADIEASKAGVEASGLKVAWLDTSPEALIEARSRHQERLRLQQFVSCWYLGQPTDVNMWSQYAGGHGVCVVSRFDLFEAALPRKWKYPIYSTVVSYTDYEPASIPYGNGLDNIRHKRTAFRHESELRFIVDTHGKENQMQIGLRIPIDLRSAVSGVVIRNAEADSTAQRVRELLESVALDPNIVRSAGGHDVSESDTST